MHSTSNNGAYIGITIYCQEPWERSETSWTLLIGQRSATGFGFNGWSEITSYTDSTLGKKYFVYRPYHDFDLIKATIKPDTYKGKPVISILLDLYSRS